MKVSHPSRRFDIYLRVFFAFGWLAFAPALLALDVGVQVERSTADQATLEELAQSAESNPCVLLRNDNLLFGVARQIGSYVIVKTSEGSEIKLKHEEVLCWADSPRHLYRYRVDHRQRGDVPAMLRDARWCIRYGLHDLAAREIVAVNRIAPNSQEVISVEAQLRSAWDQHSQNMASSTPLSSSVTEESEKLELADDSRHEKKNLSSGFASDSKSTGSQDDFDVRTVEHDTGVLGYFASHIQPMLVNRCGVCHGQGAEGVDQAGWPLLVPTVGARASATMTRENLKSAIAYIDQETPSASPLLLKATESHGGGAAALNLRNPAAVESLQRWTSHVAAVLRHANQPDEPVRLNLANGAESIPRADRVSRIAKRDENEQALANGTFTSVGVLPTAKDLRADRVAPSRLPLVSNPFDPDLFNRQLDLRAQAD